MFHKCNNIISSNLINKKYKNKIKWQFHFHIIYIDQLLITFIEQPVICLKLIVKLNTYR